MGMPRGRSRFNELFAQVAGVFSNAHVCRHGRSYVLGLLSQTERKNSWQLAEINGAHI
jgi:SRSO17 transposase